MRRAVTLCIGGACLLLGGGLPASGAQADPPVEACATHRDVLGLSRIVEVDTTGGPQFGRAPHGGYDFLKDGEVVLTFDDGPLRSHTRAVLKALAENCTKATFFMVGRMAAADPAMVREVASQGHTIAAHTWSHAKLQGLPEDKAKDEIELGFSAVAGALQAPVAPFFRFPYLRTSQEALDHLKARDIASFAIDIDSRDFRTRDGAAVEKTVLTQLQARGKGIVLFHDIQPSTAAALPEILGELKKRGFKVVHMVPKHAVTTLPAYDAQAEKLISHRALAAGKNPLAARAPTWGQSHATEREVLPWAASATITDPQATVPWYKQWFTP